MRVKMCLALPGKIKKIKGKNAVIDYGGVEREARIDLVDAKVGEWVLVHAGYAINKVGEGYALETLGMVGDAFE